MQTPQRILRVVRSLGVESMQEDHHKPELSGVQSLADALGGETHVRYPSGSTTCDLVVSEYGDSIWIEVKFASTYKSASQPNLAGIPIRRQLTGPVTGSAVKDVRDKLMTMVDHRSAQHIGFLLVAFHSADLPLRKADVEQLELKAGLREAPWERFVEDDWVNPANESCRIRAYCWQRPA